MKGGGGRNPVFPGTRFVDRPTPFIKNVQEKYFIYLYFAAPTRSLRRLAATQGPVFSWKRICGLPFPTPSPCKIIVQEKLSYYG